MESLGDLTLNVEKPLSETNQNIKQSPNKQENLNESTTQHITSLSSIADSSANISKVTNLGYKLTSPVLPNKTTCNVMPISTPAFHSTGKTTTTNKTPVTATTTTTTVAFQGTSMAHEHYQQRTTCVNANEQQTEINQRQKPLNLLEQNNAFISPVRGSCSSISSHQQTIEKLSRPLAFDKVKK